MAKGFVDFLWRRDGLRSERAKEVQNFLKSIGCYYVKLG